jgi:hypothetical protein
VGVYFNSCYSATSGGRWSLCWSTSCGAARQRRTAHRGGEQANYGCSIYLTTLAGCMSLKHPKVYRTHILFTYLNSSIYCFRRLSLIPCFPSLSPYTNVLDLYLFPSMSHRHSASSPTRNYLYIVYGRRSRAYGTTPPRQRLQGYEPNTLTLTIALNVYITVTFTRAYLHNKVIHPGIQDHEVNYYKEWKQCLASTRHTTPECQERFHGYGNTHQAQTRIWWCKYVTVRWRLFYPASTFKPVVYRVVSFITL